MRLSLYSKIIRLGLPILIGQLGTIVVGFADTIMVGHYSTEALASASFVNNVFNVATFASSAPSSRRAKAAALAH